MPRSPLFWNLIAARYARQPVADPAAYQYKLDATRARLTPEARLFEFGCGTGTTALIHAPHVASIDAIDYSPKMIAIAQGKARAQGAGNVRFAVATIEDWPLPAQPYDMVLGMSILHLVSDRAAVLAKVRRLLPVGGLFLSSTACIGDMPGVVKHLLPLGSALRLLPQLRIFTADQLVADITAAGFAIEERWHPAPDKALFLIARAV